MIRLDAFLPLVDHPGLLLIMVAMFFCTLPLSALRWQILLAVQGIALPFWQLYHICAIGALTGTPLPGAVGGDALRFIYLATAVSRHRTVIGVTLLADCVLGVCGLVTVTIGTIGLQWARVADSPALAPLALSIICGFAVALACGGALLMTLDRLPVDSWRLRRRD